MKRVIAILMTVMLLVTSSPLTTPSVAMMPDESDLVPASPQATEITIEDPVGLPMEGPPTEAPLVVVEVPSDVPTNGETGSEELPVNSGNGNEGNAPNESGHLTIGFGLCIDALCNAFDTSLDGYTVTWTITNTSAANEIENLEMASVNLIRSPMNMTAMQIAAPVTVSAVFRGGYAEATYGPLPVGTYSVCLNSTAIGPNGKSATISDNTVCSEVTLTSGGAMAIPFAGFGGEVVAGEPEVVTPDGNNESEPGSNTSPISNDEVARSGSSNQTDTTSQSSEDTDVNGLPSTEPGTIDNGPIGIAVAMAATLMLAVLDTGLRLTTIRR